MIGIVDEGAAEKKAFRPTLPIYGAMGFWTVLYGLAVIVPLLVSMLLTRRARRRFCRAVICRYGRLMIYVAVWPWVRVKVLNRKEFHNRAPGIWVFNHRSASDPFLMAACGFDNLAQAVNGWPMKLPFFGFFARRVGYLDITNMSYEELLTAMRELVAENTHLMAFPEGTRSGSRRMNQFRSGVFKLAMDLRLPLYVCCIAGNENLPDRSFRFGRGTIRMAFLREFPPEEVAAAGNAFLLKNAVRKCVMQGMDALEN